ncbi:MAG: hypothetical protein KJ800_06725 [Proteobacteria bacterium]|nr:hypothetical protein [Pseudomonadota bacterium]
MKNNPQITLLASFILFCGGVSLLWPGCGNAAGNKKTNWRLTSSATFAENLVETLWTAELPPKSRYNTVGVRRLALKDRATYKGVLVHLPGSSSNGNFYTTSENSIFEFIWPTAATMSIPLNTAPVLSLKLKLIIPAWQHIRQVLCSLISKRLLNL